MTSVSKCGQGLGHGHWRGRWLCWGQPCSEIKVVAANTHPYCVGVSLWTVTFLGPVPRLRQRGPACSEGGAWGCRGWGPANFPFLVTRLLTSFPFSEGKCHWHHTTGLSARPDENSWSWRQKGCMHGLGTNLSGDRFGELLIWGSYPLLLRSYPSVRKRQRHALGSTARQQSRGRTQAPASQSGLSMKGRNLILQPCLNNGTNIHQTAQKLTPSWLPLSPALPHSAAHLLQSPARHAPTLASSSLSRTPAQVLLRSPHTHPDLCLQPVQLPGWHCYNTEPLGAPGWAIEALKDTPHLILSHHPDMPLCSLNAEILPSPDVKLSCTCSSLSWKLLPLYVHSYLNSLPNKASSLPQRELVSLVDMSKSSFLPPWEQQQHSIVEIFKHTKTENKKTQDSTKNLAYSSPSFNLHRRKPLLSHLHPPTSPSLGYLEQLQNIQIMNIVVCISKR